MSEPAALMTAKEAAERLGVSTSQLAHQVKPIQLWDGRRRWFRSDVEAFAAETKANAARLSSPRLGGETHRNGRRWNGRAWTMDGTHAS